MNKKKLLIPSVIGLAALTAVVALGADNTLAYRGDYSKQGPNYSEERHEIMEKAFEGSDYDAWKEQMDGRGRVTEVVTEENFNRFAEAHKLGQEGKTVEADEIRKELGLRTSDGESLGRGHGKGEGKVQGNGNGNGKNRGQNNKGNFIDNDGDGNCDNLK
ncbi:hypothetical protein HN784_01645 [bacterium]|mgnify:CR=1 FL=1|jgi:hypothetical protein|nr:hypothetical protein [bacterium]MBT4250966.1 hypothetical protein [bacterium]MBT4597846.1 hypothetical protein [bacterium]MBT6753962.1 hypothetical protein [bacterium]MBT7037391.1 hypothetical protein [bacterium]